MALKLHLFFFIFLYTQVTKSKLKYIDLVVEAKSGHVFSQFLDSSRITGLGKS